MTFTEFQFDLDDSLDGISNKHPISKDKPSIKHTSHHDSIKDSPSWNAWYGDTSVRPSIHSTVDLKEDFPVATHTTADFTNTIQYTFQNKPSIQIKQISRHIYIFKPKQIQSTQKDV